ACTAEVFGEMGRHWGLFRLGTEATLEEKPAWSAFTQGFMSATDGAP
ncbi:MAG: hypothetical protein ACI9MR_004985, partial [Myxococcota bacterium]